ncbi:hypothetical protein KP509_09G057300 [Ceratopteris richardii]|uniref:Large ribosomal subunit protein uL4c n=1 Tax=Ceratopteris richardii TaxID=49495 RepID=A0A8T2U731_CERRI|nr:hypothetical protein KP509_09G057300 [Ceratopteris richardii]
MAMASAANVALSTAPSSSDRASHGLNCATGTSKVLSLSKLSLIPATGLRVGSLSLHPAARTFSSARTGSYRRLKYTSAVAVSLPVLTFEGGPSGAEVELDLKCARPETARAVVHRGLITEQQNKRRGTASTLTRGEVRGGGKKPYKQKKTGRARRGSQRTPLRPGGGVIFGPKPKDWTIKINRKEKRLAISTALQYATGSFIVVEDFEDSIEPKTKAFIAAMKNWGADCSRPSLLFTTNFSENLRKSSSNVSTVKLMTPRNLNLYDILKAKKLVFTKSGIEYLNSRYGAEEDDDEWTDEEEAEAVEEENSS